MPPQQTKIGAILALIGGALALFAFFALPLFSALGFSVSASQVATGFGGLLNSSNSNSNYQLMWLAAVLPLIGAILAIAVLASKSPAAPFPPPGYNPAYPPTGYGVSYPPSFPMAPRQSGAGKGASVGIIVCSVINLLLIIIFYAAAASNFSSSSSSYSYSSSYSGMTAATFLAAGFWIYALAVLTMLIGGIVQLRSSSN